MVQRFKGNGTGTVWMDKADDGRWVKYEDYAELRSLIFRMTDSVNLSELPEGLYDDLEARGLL
ncbi:hypothetical protein LJ084_004697 [Salmonella enterica]|nr:hypothetical protein [Salmonella enterica subsp. enterica]EDQ9876428.1 hypothetical protein [Salmonella enterica subsp. enterica]EIK3148803.1 hypothetical protein [Salmonella enterica]